MIKINLNFKDWAQAVEALAPFMASLDEDSQLEAMESRGTVMLKGRGFVIRHLGELWSKPVPHKTDPEGASTPGKRLGVKQNARTTWYYHVDLLVDPNQWDEVIRSLQKYKVDVAAPIQSFNGVGPNVETVDDE